MKIPIIGAAYESRSLNVSAQRCINLFPVMEETAEGGVTALYGTPGLVEWVDTGTALPIRGMHKMGGYLYVIIGNTVYRYDTDKNKTTLTGNLLTNDGRVWTADNGTYLMIVDDTYGYYATTTTVTQITDPDFPTPKSLTFQDGYFITISNGTDSWYVSSLNDPSSWDALDYTSAEGRPDDALCILSDHREVWVFGEHTTEVYYNSGNADFPFDRVGGAYIEYGVAAPHSVTQCDNAIFWLADDLTVKRSYGYRAQIVSTRQLEYQISTYSKVDDAFGWSYTEEGHKFYILTFPSESVTWAYDAATQLWHQRSSFPINTPGDFKRHRANGYVYFDNKDLVSDYENGKIYHLDMDTYEDDDNEIRRLRSCIKLSQERKKMFFHRLEVEFEAGVGLSVDDTGIGEGDDPQAMLRWSDDGGHTWSNEHWTSIGKIGEYTNRAIWRRLGASRERIFEVSVSDPVKVVIINAYLEAGMGIS